MSGLYWLAIFLYTSRYESAEEECEELQDACARNGKAQCRVCAPGRAKDNTVTNTRGKKM